jgi:2-C-methyl-D-erythritol 4-phosphate cytidylyltransferase
MNNIGVILACGLGVRFESRIPKTFVKLNGKHVIQYSVDAMINSNVFSKIIVMVSNKKYYNYTHEKVVIVEAKTKTRNETVLRAIQYIETNQRKLQPRNVLFHDAARPLIRADEFKPFIDELSTNDACVTRAGVVDALIQQINGTACEQNRDEYVLVQTPEAFRYEILVASKDNLKTSTKNSIVATIGVGSCGFISLTRHSNLKITTPKDLFIAEQLLKYTPYIKSEPVAMKKALVFGGHGGIGKEVCKQLCKRGCEVFAPTHEQHDLTLTTLQWDWLQQFDVIINCVGLATKDEDGLLLPFNTIMRTNVLGSLNILNALNQRPSESRKNVVLVSSSAATRGRQGLTLYSASKAALHSITESLSGELKEKNTYVNIVCPEKVNTAMAKRLHGTINTKETLTPSEVARAIISYCKTDEAGSIVHIRKGMKC